MLGIAVLIAYEICGVTQAFALCKRRSALIKVWLGLVMGLMQFMWLPSLWAFAFGFALTANMLALITSMAAALGLALRRKNDPPRWTIAESAAHAPVFVSEKAGAHGKCDALPPAGLTLLIMIPIVLLVGYLQYTHTIRKIDGSLYVGQSTYGDLCMHLSFATGLVGQSYPPEYTLLPGNTLGYPFLVDALSSSMLVFGTPLDLAFSIPGTVMTTLVYLGFFLFSYEITRSRAASVLSLALLLFSGGLGFLYTLDLAGETSFTALKNALYSYYQAPANMPEYNLRWVNALCDLLIPQRTLMAGWMCALPALYLLYTAMKTRRRSDYVALGLWTGPMVMIHTHSFLAVGMISLGAMIDSLLRQRKRIQLFGCFALYGLIAALLALPQLLVWTFPQTFDGGSLRVLFNWVNNTQNGSLRDGYFWFWIKNVGPVFILIPIAILSSASRRARALGLGSLLLFILAETVLFQPNVYDNNKLFYVAYIAMLPFASKLACDIYSRLKGIRLRSLLAAGFVFVCSASGAISIARESISSYQVFYKQQVLAAEFIKEHTPKDALFLTASNHNNAVASLSGRKIVCGSGSYLYYHGLDYQRQEAEAVLMLAYPRELEYLYSQYGVDYVYLSNYEKSVTEVWNIFVPDASLVKEGYTPDMDALESMYPCVYEGGDLYGNVRIYAVSQRARVKFQEEHPESLQ